MSWTITFTELLAFVLFIFILQAANCSSGFVVNVNGREYVMRIGHKEGARLAGSESIQPEFRQEALSVSE